MSIATRCAVIEQATGIVDNIIVAEPGSEVPEGYALIEVMNDQWCCIERSRWNGMDFEPVDGD